MLLYTHRRFLDHEMLRGHPESPARLEAVLKHLETTGLLQSLIQRDPPPATAEQLALVHEPGYLAELQRLSPQQGLTALDPDTFLCPHTLEAATLAAGAVADAVRAVLAGEDERAFCAVRPPGHHAEAGSGMGFCFYNNIALGAAVALAAPDIERVAIVDFDVHHCNGTVDIFKDRPEVLVCSSFQHPFYPHRYAELSRPNVVLTPLPAGCSGPQFRRALELDWIPALDDHAPQLILVSAGFDGHRLDPLAELNLREADYRWATRLIVDAANRHANGRIVSTLEGGYQLEALARCVAAHIEVLAAA